MRVRVNEAEVKKEKTVVNGLCAEKSKWKSINMLFFVETNVLKEPNVWRSEYVNTTC